MENPVVLYREDPGRTEPRRGREGHDRRGERRRHPRGTRRAFLGTLRERTAHPVPAGSGLDAQFDRDGNWDRQDAARRGRGRRWQGHCKEFERKGNPRAPGPLPGGEARGEPGRGPRLHPGPWEPRGEPRSPPTNRDEERDRGGDSRETRDDAGPPRRHGRSHPGRGVPQTRVPVRAHRLPDLETPPDSTVGIVTTPAVAGERSNDTKLKYRKPMRGTADGDPVMTSTMKAAVKLEPAPNSTELRNIPIPDPSNQEVLIRVDIASICGTDVHIYDWDAWAARRIKVPLVQGHEFAGHIEKLGSGVTGLRKDDYVSAEGHIACGRCYMCRTGNAHVCKNVSILGIDRAGSFAQYMTVPASNVIVNDDDLPLDLATMQDPLGNAVYTVTNANVPGKTVAIFGLGPIGLMAVALCRGMAARTVIAIGHRNQYRMDLAKTVGASLVLRSGESLVDEVMDATAGEGVDEVLELSGSEAAVEHAIRVVRPAGGIHLLGLFPKPLSLDISEFVTKGLSMYGIHGRLMYKTWMQMGGLLKSGNVNLKPILTHKFPLDDYNEAMGVMRSGNCGKVAFPMEA